MYKKKVILFSERDRDIFDDVFIMIAGGLGAFGIEDLFALNWFGATLKIAIAYGIIQLVVIYLRKKSDKKKVKTDLNNDSD